MGNFEGMGWGMGWGMGGFGGLVLVAVVVVLGIAALAVSRRNS